MSATLSFIGRSVRARRGQWAAVLAGFVMLYYLSQLAAMLVQFDDLPNYVTLYNWPVNVWTIFASTPSLADAIEIAREEWLFEIGYMNYAFGNGISEWSVTIWPTKLVMVILAGALVASISVLLLADRRAACSAWARRGALAATGGGAFLVGLSSATLSWVVCCATPTWVVSLALLGMSPGLALWLEPMGVAMTALGFALLIAAMALIARRRLAAGTDVARAGARMTPSLHTRG